MSDNATLTETRLDIRTRTVLFTSGLFDNQEANALWQQWLSSDRRKAYMEHIARHSFIG